MSKYYAGRTGVDYQDLMSEAWIEIFTRLPQTNIDMGDASQFLIKHARWKMLDYIGYRNSRAKLWIQTDEEMLDDWDAKDRRVEFNEDYLIQLLDVENDGRLSPMQKDIVFMLELAYTWAEIGKALGMSSPGVAYHVRHIRKTYNGTE